MTMLSSSRNRVEKAVARKTRIPTAPIAMGIDPSGGGTDKFCIVFVRGRKVIAKLSASALLIRRSGRWKALVTSSTQSKNSSLMVLGLTRAVGWPHLRPSEGTWLR
jgi:hypothetical protein